MAIITIDTREQSKKIPSGLKRLGHTIIREKLKCGDYLIHGSPNILVERKTSSDLMNSLKDGRLWNQLGMLKNLNKKKFIVLLLIEGNPIKVSLLGKRKRRGWDANAIVGVMNSIQLDWGIPYIFSPNSWWTVMNISSLAKFMEPSERAKKVRFGKTPEDPNTRIQYIVEGIPQVGPATARKLLKEFGTVRKIARAKHSELVRVAGKTKGPLIYKLLRREWKDKPKTTKRKKKRRPPIPCEECEGTGWVALAKRERRSCKVCKGTGKVRADKSAA